MFMDSSGECGDVGLMSADKLRCVAFSGDIQGWSRVGSGMM